MGINIRGIEFDTAGEAIQYTDASGTGVAISVGGRRFVVEQAEADRLASAGVEFAYLVDHEMTDGSLRVMTIPVNG